MKEYSQDFEYTWGDFMTSFLGLEVEQNKGQIWLHLDTYVNEMLEDYKAYIKRDLKPKKIPMQPGVVLTKDYAPEPQLQKNRKYNDHLLQKYNLLQTGSGMMFLLQHHNWLVSVHLWAYRIGLPCIMWWDICTAIQVSNLYTGVETAIDWMVALILIEEIVSHVGLQQDCWHDTTNPSCCGDQECKRQSRCQLRKLNIIPHPKLQSR